MADTVMSSKGQIVISKELRESENWKPGTRFIEQKTLFGIKLIPIPKYPLMALRGIAKHSKITVEDLKKLRQEDNEIDGMK